MAAAAARRTRRGKKKNKQTDIKHTQEGDKTHHVAVSKSPAFPCWTDAYMLGYSCLTLVQAKQHIRHTVHQTSN
jgi:hypothetical protein